MANIITKKISVKASTAKPSGKPLSEDKTLGLDPDIRFYNIEDGDDTAEGEESEIIVVHNSSLAESKQNLVKMKFPYIDTFDHERSIVVSAMRNLTVGVFEHLEITSSIDEDQRVAFMQRILRLSALRKYRAVLVECKQLVKEIAGDKWDLGKLKGLSTDDLWD